MSSKLENESNDCVPCAPVISGKCVRIFMEAFEHFGASGRRVSRRRDSVRQLDRGRRPLLLLGINYARPKESL